jgi:hypothetical protein
MNPLPYMNYLTIRFDGKAVPYGAHSEPREDGTQNFGFRNVKQNASAIDEIPELLKDPALKAIVKALNDPKCGLFSVGCLSHEVLEQQQHQVIGYVEFAINSKTASKDAAVYFPLFFKFQQFLQFNKFDQRVSLHWELQPAVFWELNTDGFTCVININTQFYPTLEAARDSWGETLAALEAFLGGFPIMVDDPLYQAGGTQPNLT